MKLGLGVKLKRKLIAIAVNCYIKYSSRKDIISSERLNDKEILYMSAVVKHRVTFCPIIGYVVVCVVLNFTKNNWSYQKHSCLLVTDFVHPQIRPLNGNDLGMKKSTVWVFSVQNIFMHPIYTSILNQKKVAHKCESGLTVRQ